MFLGLKAGATAFLTSFQYSSVCDVKIFGFPLACSSYNKTHVSGCAPVHLILFMLRGNGIGWVTVG